MEDSKEKQRCISISRASEIAKALIYEKSHFAEEGEITHLQAHAPCCNLVAQQMYLIEPARTRKTILQYEETILRRLRNQSVIIQPKPDIIVIDNRDNHERLIVPKTEISCITESEAEALNLQWVEDIQTLSVARSEEIVRHLRSDKCINCHSKLQELPHISFLSLGSNNFDLAWYVENHIQY